MEDHHREEEQHPRPAPRDIRERAWVEGRGDAPDGALENAEGVRAVGPHPLAAAAPMTAAAANDRRSRCQGGGNLLIRRLLSSAAAAMPSLPLPTTMFATLPSRKKMSAREPKNNNRAWVTQTFPPILNDICKSSHQLNRLRVALRPSLAVHASSLAHAKPPITSRWTRVMLPPSTANSRRPKAAIIANTTSHNHLRYIIISGLLPRASRERSGRERRRHHRREKLERGDGCAWRGDEIFLSNVL